MAKILSVLLTLSLIGYAFGIQCYQCMNNKDCSDIGNTLDLKCGKPLMPKHETYCIKKVIEDSQTKKTNITRTCVVVDPSNKDEHCKHTDTKSKQLVCDLCNTDYCNTSTTASISMFTIVGATITYFITKYFY